VEITKQNGCLKISTTDLISLEDAYLLIDKIKEFVSSNFLDEDIVERYFTSNTNEVGLFWYFIKKDDIIIPKCKSIQWNKSNIRNCIDIVKSESNFHSLAHDEIGQQLMQTSLSQLINTLGQS